MTFIQRIMLQHANPKKLIIDSLGVVIAMVLFWHNDVLVALVVLFGFSTIGTLVAWGKNEAALAKSSLGKFMLGQSNPVNMIVRLIGFITSSYGFWAHSLVYILVGIVIIVIARRWNTVAL